MSERKVLVQYGERRKVLVVDGTFPSTVKKEFKIDSAETLVFQEYDDEWGEYLDIDEVDLASLKDKGKLRVILKENKSNQATKSSSITCTLTCNPTTCTSTSKTGSARPACGSSPGLVQSTICVNNGNIQVGPKVKVCQICKSEDPDNAQEQVLWIQCDTFDMYHQVCVRASWPPLLCPAEDDIF